MAPRPGTLPLTHSWNVPDSPGPEFPRGSAFRPWDGGIPVPFSPCGNGQHGRGRPAEPAQAAGSCELPAAPGWQWGRCPAGNSEDTLPALPPPRQAQGLQGAAFSWRPEVGVCLQHMAIRPLSFSFNKAELPEPQSTRAGALVPVAHPARATSGPSGPAPVRSLLGLAPAPFPLFPLPVQATVAAPLPPSPPNLPPLRRGRMGATVAIQA